MKFRISKENFLLGLQQVQHVVAARTTLPILSNVMLEAREGELKLTTTDLDVGVSGSVESDVGEDGVTTLPARRLASIIKELPSESVGEIAQIGHGRRLADASVRVARGADLDALSERGCRVVCRRGGGHDRTRDRQLRVQVENSCCEILGQ